MGNDTLFCWLGMADIKASSELDDVGLGPVGQAVSDRAYDELVLLSDWEKAVTEKYLSWLKKKTKTRIDLHYVTLSSPTDFGEIYQAATEIISQKKKNIGSDINLVYHLSPGTPAMAAVWILLAKTLFPGELIESSKEHGVKTVSIPFDISIDFIPKLFKKPDITLKRLAAGLSPTAPEFEDIIHRSEVMQRVILKARRIAPRAVPVLIEGETGTGKELFARAIHKASPRKNKPFIAINCGAIPEELVESELFGYEKGAFTGAVKAQMGQFEAAHEGTIFLDEIGELPKNVQVKLLRVLQDGEVKRIGAAKSKKLDVRIISATNRNLINEVEVGSFREDLFYRLNVTMIKLPPLRERPGDVSLLIDQFLEQINKESINEPGYKHKILSASAKNSLLKHVWPGNVRELQNTLTRAAILSGDEIIQVEDIKEALIYNPAGSKEIDLILNQPLNNGINLPEIIRTVVVHYLARGLSETNRNKTKTAEILGLPNYQTLTYWLKKYGLE